MAGRPAARLRFLRPEEITWKLLFCPYRGVCRAGARGEKNCVNQRAVNQLSGLRCLLLAAAAMRRRRQPLAAPVGQRVSGQRVRYLTVEE